MHHVWMCQESLINQVYLLHWSMLYTIGITEKDEWLQNHEVGQFFAVEVKKKHLQSKQKEESSGEEEKTEISAARAEVLSSYYTGWRRANPAELHRISFFFSPFRFLQPSLFFIFFNHLLASPCLHFCASSVFSFPLSGADLIALSTFYHFSFLHELFAILEKIWAGLKLSELIIVSKMCFFSACHFPALLNVLQQKCAITEKKGKKQIFFFKQQLTPFSVRSTSCKYIRLFDGLYL